MRKENRHMLLGEKIGVGASAELYKCGDGKIFKKFHEDKPDVSILNEYGCTKEVQGLSIRVPKVYEVHLEQKNRGIVMEYLQGKSMLDEIYELQSVSKGKERIEQMCREFARIHHKMHQIKSRSLLDGHEWLKQRISWCGELSENEKEMLYEALFHLPLEEALCHNDYHPGNLIDVEGEFCVIDWCDASSGNPWMDVARTMIVFESEDIPEGMSPEGVRQLNKVRRWIGETYMDEYLCLSGKNSRELQLWMPIVAASRLCNERGVDKERLLTKVKTFLNSK